MKRLLLMAFVLLQAWAAWSQELPQFLYNDYEGWTYNNPGVPLSPEAIGSAKVRLYVDSQGRVLTLTSPDFACAGLDSIHADVRWKSADQTVSLTMVLDDTEGTPLDSATCLPSNAGSEQEFAYTIAVPAGLTTARVRFVSWNAVAGTSGAVRRVLLSGIAAVTPPPVVTSGDVDGNGKVNIADVTTLINYLLSNHGDINTTAADTDGNGKISIADVTTLINMLLSGNHVRA